MFQGETSIVLRLQWRENREKYFQFGTLKHDWVALGGQHMDAKGITPATRNIIDLNVFLRIKFSDPPQGLILAIVHSQRR